MIETNMTAELTWTEYQARPTVSKPGDHLLLRAEMDLIIAFSGCPQDILPINNTKPTEAHFQIL